MSQVNANQLPEIEGWIAGFGGELSTRDFLLGCVSVGKAAAVVELLWPRFIERSGCVILEWAYGKDELIQWLQKSNGDVSAVEALFNHVHLWDIFKPTSEIEERFLEQLLQRMQACWRDTATAQFPGRSFDVSISIDESDYGPTISMRTASEVQADA